MSLIIGILTFLLIVNCAVLVLLILVQLPKKDAGAGLAFGGGAADALFGAGSGNALTKITKWAAGLFIALAVVLGLCQTNMHKSSASEFGQGVEQQQQQMQTATPSAPQAVPQATPPASSATPAVLPLPSSTNVLAPATTSGK